MRRFKIAAVIISIVFFAATSCKIVNPEEDAIRKSISRYNHALVLAYKDLNYEELKGVASERQVNKVSVIVESFISGDEILDAELLRVDFKEIKVEGDAARVRTSEDWSYRWINYKTGEEVEPLKEIHYEMIYHLIKKDGKWLTDKTEDVKEGGGSIVKTKPQP